MIKIKEIRFCKNCQKILIRSQKKFCSHYCQQEYIYKEYIARWKNGEEKGNKGEYFISDYIRRYLKEKYDNKCALCGWGEVNKYTGNVPLEIEHIDGNYKNNKEENLILLCPNCHSLTSTYKGANIGHGRLTRKKYSDKYKTEPSEEILDNIKKENKKYYCQKCGKEVTCKSVLCRKCRNEERRNNFIVTNEITREELKEKIRTFSFVAIGEEYGVTDNAVRKWCKIYNLPFKKTEIDKYTDEEWKLL